MLTQTSSTPSLSQESAGQCRVPDGQEQLHATAAREITAHANDAGLCAAERFVAVVGPPAVGKSTVTRTLADYLGAQVFRLREFAHEFRSHDTIDERLFDTRDSLDWLPEETIFLLLQAAFIQRQFQTCGLVVLENFPGSLTQLLLLRATADQLRAPLMLIELAADDIVVAAQARTRRVCPTCEPDPRGDPHRPAHPAAHDLNRCDSCSGELLPRQGDEPERFAGRLARFRRRIPAIRRAATALQLPYHRADATSDPDTCLQSVVTALAATEPLAHLLGSRRKRF
jgi:adenylate kinase family enzyme